VLNTATMKVIITKVTAVTTAFASSASFSSSFTAS
jgi:hypothetical protein